MLFGEKGRQLVKNKFGSFGLGFLGKKDTDIHMERTVGSTNIGQCVQKVADDHFIVVVKVLCSYGVTPSNGDTTTKALETLFIGFI